MISVAGVSMGPLAGTPHESAQAMDAAIAGAADAAIRQTGDGLTLTTLMQTTKYRIRSQGPKAALPKEMPFRMDDIDAAALESLAGQ